MGKILVSLEIPVMREKYDVWVPDDLIVGSLVPVLAQGVFDVSGGKYSVTGYEMLMKLKPDGLMMPNRTLKEYGVRDGTPLMMI